MKTDILTVVCFYNKSRHDIIFHNIKLRITQLEKNEVSFDILYYHFYFYTLKDVANRQLW